MLGLKMIGAAALLIAGTAPAMAQDTMGAQNGSGMSGNTTMPSNSMGSSSMSSGSMSKSQMAAMKKCQAMSSDMMMKNKKCASMAKMHPDMMQSGSSTTN